MSTTGNKKVESLFKVIEIALACPDQLTFQWIGQREYSSSS